MTMLIALVLAAQIVTSQGVDSVLRARYTPDGPGAAVLVVHQGRVAQSVVGVGDLQERWALSDSTNFYLASATKPFTALVIHQLVRDGHLSYSDRLVRWIPELNASDSSITLQHLLTHSSGLADFYDFIDWPRFRRMDNRGVLDTTRAHPTPTFAPGSKYEYSNTNYVLLALIAERSSGRSLGELLHERVFTPAGMRAVLYDDTTRHVPLRARAYARNASGYRLSDLDALELPDGRRITFTFVQTGQGGLFASLRDLGAWVQALLDASLLSDADKAAIVRAQRPAEGQPGIAEVRGVGYGWFESARGGQRVFWHDGSRGGSRTAVVLVPDAQLGIVVLSNVAHTDPLELATVFLDRALAAR